MLKDQRLRPQFRIKHPTEFRQVYDAKTASHGPNLVVFYRPNGLEFSRLGVSVSRKNGNAVCRNRIKRVFREAFRRSFEILPKGYDFVLIPRRSVKRYKTKDIQEALKVFTQKIPEQKFTTQVASDATGDLKKKADHTKGRP